VGKPNACDRRILSLRRTALQSYLWFAGSNFAEGNPLKENVMNDELETELELEIVELGDAKEETKGIKGSGFVEDDVSLPRYQAV